MTDRERRQRRLLAVRTLQADLAAARVRTLQLQQQQDEGDLAAVQATVCGGSAQDDWLLLCAERELRTLHIGQLTACMEQRQPALEAEREQERLCRQQREQMQQMCDRTEATIRTATERAEQARLDDLFNAARLRRLALANPNP